MIPFGPLSVRYMHAANRVLAGHRETPQRFKPLSYRLIRGQGDVEGIASLFGFILQQLLAEFRDDPSRPAHLADLVERARVLVEVAFTAGDADRLLSNVVALAPLRRRRRNIHSHGWIGSDRVLLVLRDMLPVLQSLGAGASWTDCRPPFRVWFIEYAVAYYVADYDYDHFVMTGSGVAERFKLIALWCRSNLLGDGPNSRATSATP